MIGITNPAAYVIYEATITDPEQYEQYKTRAAASVAAAGGRYLARGGAVESFEGARPARVVILEFPTYERANREIESARKSAVADIYAQVAVLSRVTQIFEHHGVEPSGQERYIAETFCPRAARRVESNLNQIESNDDERMTAIAKLAYKRGEYGYALLDD